MKIPNTKYELPDYYINHIDDNMVAASSFEKGYIAFPKEHYHLASYDEYIKYCRSHFTPIR